MSLRSVLVTAVACVLAFPASAAEVARARWLMGTLFTASATCAAADTMDTGEALDAALDEVASLERSLSNWRSDSELSRLNAADTSVALSEPLAAVLDSSLALAALTGGAFDPTVEPLTLAYDLRGRGRVPDAALLARARVRVGWRHVALDAAARRAELHGAGLDLGGIAKGFALDRAAASLAAAGVRSGQLDAGGQRLVLGEPREVAVASPEDRDTPALSVRVGPGSLSTSAQSERAVRVHGRSIGHVLDPRTGEPVPARASVSVFAASGTRADALSTALLVLGHDGARAFAAAHPEIGVLWLEPAGRRVRAYAWNLQLLEHASFVDIVPTDHGPELARIP